MTALPDSSLDEELLNKLMRSAHVAVRVPMRIRICRYFKERETDSHTMELDVGDDIVATQKAVTKIVSRWKGGFELGTRYIVERIE